MKEYTKLKLQYEKAMSKSTIAASYGKPSGLNNAGGPQVEPLYESGLRQQPIGHVNSRIGVSKP